MSIVDRDYRPNNTELLEALGEYENSFISTLQARGINPDVLAQIEQTQSKVSLEAEWDEEDGHLQASSHLAGLINGIYDGVPQQDFYIKKVNFYQQNAILQNEFGSTNGNWRDDGQFIFNDQTSLVAINKNLYFDLKKGSVAVGSVYINEPAYYESVNGSRDSTVWSSRRLSADIATDLSSFLNSVNLRFNSRIAIYRSTPDDLF